MIHSMCLFRVFWCFNKFFNGKKKKKKDYTTYCKPSLSQSPFSLSRGNHSWFSFLERFSRRCVCLMINGSVLYCSCCIFFNLVYNLEDHYISYVQRCLVPYNSFIILHCIDLHTFNYPSWWTFRLSPVFCKYTVVNILSRYSILCILVSL